jgi:protein O-GlcNAc transferase
VVEPADRAIELPGDGAELADDDLDGLDAAGLSARADAHHARGELGPAIEAYERALGRDPDLADAWWGLGCARASRDEQDAAASCFARLAELRPASVEARHNLGRALFELGRVDEALAAFETAWSVGPNPLTARMIAIVAQGAPSLDDRDVAEARRRWTSTLPRRAGSPPRPGPLDGRPLRVGYVSAFFGDRNWMKPVWGVINHHDRARFEVHLFSDAPAERLDSGYRPDPRDHVHDVGSLDHEGVARVVEARGIDVLVDLNGYSRPERLAVFALRPSPVQVAWFNTFAPTGLDAFDAVVGDPVVLPAGSESGFGEPTARVPGCYLSFEVDYPVPEVAPPPCLGRGPLSFGSLAPLYKITPEVVAAWSRLLAACPGARLVLRSRSLGTEDNRASVRRAFGHRGIDPDRLELLGPAEHFAFLETYGAIDVALDTFPYNGGTTTMEALWQGVPVLALEGDRWASRVAASLLRAAGLGEFVARGVEGFVGLGAALAADPATPGRLSALRRSLRDRLRRSAAGDVPALASALESLYDRLRGRRDADADGAGDST